jgi:hypothetical protein
VDNGDMDMVTQKLEPETERALRERMEADYEHAQKATAQYFEVLRLHLKDLASDDLILSILDSYSASRAREILTLRALEGCGWR